MKLFVVCLLLLYCSQVVYAQTIDSRFGKVFTPKGTLRALIIYAGFEGFEETESGADWDGNQPFPNWKHEDLFQTDQEKFGTQLPDTLPVSLSDFYYFQSNPENRFKFLVDRFPHRINIDIDKANSFSSCNRLVIEKIAKDYPDFDWGRHDQRTNSPNFRFDNSISKPDMQPDYIIIAYRFRKPWNKYPKALMDNWTTTYSLMDGLYGLNVNGYTFDNSGFTLGDFDCRLSNLKGLFVHEVAHELYSCPHYSGANHALGNYLFNITAGSDMMSDWRGFIASAFERWLLGWTEIKHDLKDYKGNGKYVLKDFVTTGECIRLQVPHDTNQHIWIENRQRLAALDHNAWKGQLIGLPPGSKGIADGDTGLYIYNENVLSAREKISTSLVYTLDHVNGIMPLHARGNHDYKFPHKLTYTTDHTPSEQRVYWNNKVYWFEQGKPNPISGINPFICYRNDMDSSGAIDKKISRNGEYNGIADAESYPILMEKVKDTFLLTYAHIGGRNADVQHRRPDTFVEGDELGIAHNPMLINRPRYIAQGDSLTPYYLNGLYLKVIKQKNKEITVKIKFNQTAVDSDARWCGYIICKDVPAAAKGYDVDVQKGVTVSLETSGTINNTKKKEVQFMSPSTLVIDNGAILNLRKNATLRIAKNNTLIIKKGGKINRHATAKIDLEEGALFVDENDE